MTWRTPQDLHEAIHALKEAYGQDDIGYLHWDHVTALEAVVEELAALRERCKPTSPPYLPCLWHDQHDDSCPWCLRAERATLLAALQSTYSLLSLLVHRADIRLGGTGVATMQEACETLGQAEKVLRPIWAAIMSKQGQGRE